MELGALVCTARDPRCGDCPVADRCSWRAAGRPRYDGPRRRPQGFAGTDRQVRGLIMAALRESGGPVPVASLEPLCSDADQRERALAGLIEDGLAVQQPDGRLTLPGSAAVPPAAARG
jgi:A/G-specific adenine glycosylase